jgi:phosphoribosylformylglycinamidine cyclo-ligase
MSGHTYASSGVDIERGDAIARFVAGIDSPAVSKGLGGFAGATELDLRGYRQPVLLSTTDGVGTKLLVAKRLRRFDTIGIDLVAMCVNDLAVSGAWPVQFLDYIACGRIRREVTHAILTGIVRGCEEAGCTLVGGETAEMPDVYAQEDFDLAGFCTGLAEKDEILPHADRIRAGCPVYGLPSSGIHSNGFSLARKVLANEPTPVWEELLTPTRIYVSTLKQLFETKAVLAAAHVTGGGLVGNLTRVVPPGLALELSHDWPCPDIFPRIQQLGGIPREEMERVFNMGIGISLVVDAGRQDAFEEHARASGIRIHRIGRVVDG